MSSIKTILISQPSPSTSKNPYSELQEEYNLTIDYRPFIYTDGIDYRDFRKTGIDISQHKAIIFTSRVAVDYFFSLIKDMKVKLPEKIKYYCVSESIAYYLQKYIVYRRRSIFYARNLEGLEKDFKNNKVKYLLPCSDIINANITTVLGSMNVDYSKAIMYRTLCSDLSDLEDIYYDVLVFFSPAGIRSLFQNFPEFKQNTTKIAVFGSTTLEEAKQKGLEVNICAPQPETPSMSKAIEVFIKKEKKQKKQKTV